MKVTLLGTIILAIQMSNAVYVGVDSKVISVGSEIANIAPQQKIHQAGDLIFAYAGIFKDTQGTIDVDAAADAAIAAGGDLEMVVDRFATAIEPQLSASLQDIGRRGRTCSWNQLGFYSSCVGRMARHAHPKLNGDR